MSKKNAFDFIQMGLRSKRHLENLAAERKKQENKDAQAFNKAFSDKTYTVAKKVIENVEKVADYDYEAFFSRVNKVFEDPKQMSQDVRQARSKDFDDITRDKVKNFNINDYPKIRKDYRDSIIEKTKKNIQKKKEEADMRQQNQVPVVTPSESSEEIIDAKVTILHVIKDDNKVPVAVGDHKPQEHHEASTQEVNFSQDQPIAEEQTPLPQAILDEDIPVDDMSLDLKTTPEPIPETSDETISGPTLPKEDHVSTLADSPDESDHEVLEIPDDSCHETVHVDMEEDVTEKSRPKEKVTVQHNTESYSKAETIKNKKYYRKQQKDKFARRMSVDLEDSLIVKKKRSLNRLFKFSLSFKLSFVFILLLIVTVVTLSAAFYLGIDYVIALRDAGKMLDIQMFKDVLLVLLIIFDMAAILLSISIGTKASRELVSPIDEMTRIVQQINAREMDRRLDVKGMHDELKELAMTFNEMLDRIESSYETQNRFTSDASHELRTPIAVIQGYINMLDRWGKADGEILDESIEAIKSESNNMKRLTEKLLLLAKADKGILEMDFQPFSLKDLINEITRETTMIDSNHTISNEINDVDEIVADRESLKQAIRVFVDNSVKYTPENGHIQINSYFRKRKIYIEIADDGIGISKEDMDNIFNRFYRVDKSRTKESGGHGLGLSIAKWIISEHKGEIEVKSELNKGTVITIILTPMT